MRPALAVPAAEVDAAQGLGLGVERIEERPPPALETGAGDKGHLQHATARELARLGHGERDDPAGIADDEHAHALGHDEPQDVDWLVAPDALCRASEDRLEDRPAAGDLIERRQAD